MKSFSGGCLCKAVRFTVDSVERSHHVCHCTMCRKWAGTSVMAAEVTGMHFEDERTIERFDSSEWAQRGFCNKCGSNLFYYLKPRNLYMVSVGAFDDTSGFKLVKEIFVDRKPSGYCFGGDLEQKTEEEVMAEFG